MIDYLMKVIEKSIPLNLTEKKLIENLFKEKKYGKGDFFLAEREICKQIGFITKGIMRYYINDDGEDKTYGFSQENDFVCNYESFVPQTPSSQIIQALENCELFVISYDDLQDFYSKVKGGERFGRLVIEQVFIQTSKERNSFYTDPPELRYEKFIRQHPRLQQRLSQYHIASYVGVKPQSLSRIRKRLSAY
jgi:CRP-like cAMP-binding protein